MTLIQAGEEPAWPSSSHIRGLLLCYRLCLGGLFYDLLKMSCAGSFGRLTYWCRLEPSADGPRTAFSLFTGTQVSTFCPLLSALKSTLTEVTGPRGAAVLV